MLHANRLVFGNRLRAIRKDKRMTLRTLSVCLGVSQPFLCEVEKGRKQMPQDRIGALAHVLGIEPHELAGIALPTVASSFDLTHDPDRQFASVREIPVPSYCVVDERSGVLRAVWERVHG